ncbi:hypothetical protein FOMPIDRAFT_1051918 [Fomitopsis schrenkii]|uniref:Uncharacterized protein n=1 Tax=Fomitopsis schrenkii TaxID=2126942 RepID=S8DY91_FOMSC|nr:hypothetical protein FOMPIDRAFT_1051918 [Fomitopsis schrenkii]
MERGDAMDIYVKPDALAFVKRLRRLEVLDLTLREVIVMGIETRSAHVCIWTSCKREQPIYADPDSPPPTSPA